jgi:hypothetical protein
MFNNDKTGSFKDAMKKHFFNYVDFPSSFLPPPPQNYFLLDNDGEILFDNSDEPFLVE